MAVDVKQELEGVVLHELNESLSNIKDVIEVLSEQKIVSTKERTITRFVGKDANVLTTADKYGKMASTYIANYEDRVYTKDEYTLPKSDGIGFTIPRDALDIFGIDKSMVNGGAKISNKQMMAVVAGIKPELERLYRKIRVKRRKQVTDLLSQLHAVVQPSQKPLGFNPVDTDTIRNTGIWEYTNKLDAVLTLDEFKKAVNIFAAKQKTTYNEDYMISKPIMLLHAEDYALAETIMLPHLSVNVLNRTAGDSILPERLNIKSVGVYNDAARPSDWIVLGENHKIYRLAGVSPTSEITNGITVDVEWIPEGLGDKLAGLRITVYDKSIMVCDSALDIVKAVVA